MFIFNKSEQLLTTVLTSKKPITVYKQAIFSYIYIMSKLIVFRIFGGTVGFLIMPKKGKSFPEKRYKIYLK